MGGSLATGTPWVESLGHCQPGLEIQRGQLPRNSQGAKAALGRAGGDRVESRVPEGTSSVERLSQRPR